jgi:hypothetical protein
MAAAKELLRYHNADYHPGIRVLCHPGGHDHMGFDKALAPQPHLTPAGKFGRRHNYAARGGRDHLIAQGSTMTYRTSRDMYPVRRN